MNRICGGIPAYSGRNPVSGCTVERVAAILDRIEPPSVGGVTSVDVTLEPGDPHEDAASVIDVVVENSPLSFTLYEKRDGSCSYVLASGLRRAKHATASSPVWGGLKRLIVEVVEAARALRPEHICRIVRSAPLSFHVDVENGRCSGTHYVSSAFVEVTPGAGLRFRVVMHVRVSSEGAVDIYEMNGRVRCSGDRRTEVRLSGVTETMGDAAPLVRSASRLVAALSTLIGGAEGRQFVAVSKMYAMLAGRQRVDEVFDTRRFTARVSFSREPGGAVLNLVSRACMTIDEVISTLSSLVSKTSEILENRVMVMLAKRTAEGYATLLQRV